jgi:lipoate-protein ligase B
VIWLTQQHPGKQQILFSSLGRTRYGEVWDLQRALWALRTEGAIGDIVLLTEHEHVYTIGKSGDDNHLLASVEELRAGGIEVFAVDRGGDITYHGPGQLVGYPILDLNSRTPDIHKYLRDIEEVLIRTLRTYGLTGVREEGMTGVWVDGEKVAAIGVKVSRWVTMHGFALNVNTDLSKFGRIIPCGIFHKGVTSMERLLGRSVLLDEVIERLEQSFEEVFACQHVPVSAEAIREAVECGGTKEATTILIG